MSAKAERKVDNGVLSSIEWWGTIGILSCLPLLLIAKLLVPLGAVAAGLWIGGGVLAVIGLAVLYSKLHHTVTAPRHTTAPAPAPKPAAH